MREAVQPIASQYCHLHHHHHHILLIAIQDGGLLYLFSDHTEEQRLSLSCDLISQAV